MNKFVNNKIKWFYNNYIRRKIKQICFIILIIFLGVSIGNVSPLLFGKIIDVIGKFNPNKLLYLIILYFIVIMSAKLFSILEDYLGQTLSFKIVKQTQIDLFNKMITLNEKSSQKYDSGELISRLSYDSDAVVSFYLNIITSIIQIIINICISVYFIIYLSKQLSIVALFYIPISLIANIIIKKYFKELAKKRKEFNDNYYSFIYQIFNYITPIKSFNLESKMTKKYKKFTSLEYSLLKKSILLTNIDGFITTLIAVISSLFIIYYSSILINRGLLTVGLMVSFNTYINKLFDSIKQILSLNIEKQEVEVSIDRISQILLDNSEQERNGNKIVDCNNIILNNVNFSYIEEKKVLNNLSLKINKTGFYSLVGKNGCGKSTIAKLIIRLYDSDNGYIMLGNTDILECSITSIRDNITYIQQEGFFFNDTIYNNLKLANENATNDEVHKICKNVDIDDYISNLADGYNTLMGENGNNFSGGQKQKLSIARSLLKESKIYIYDESTANLDGKSEKKIIELLNKLSKDSIIIFISHKATSIVNSDNIFVVDNGSVIAEGKHKQLMERCELYNELFYNIE